MTMKTTNALIKNRGAKRIPRSSKKNRHILKGSSSTAGLMSYSKTTVTSTNFISKTKLWSMSKITKLALETNI